MASRALLGALISFGMLLPAEAAAAPEPYTLVTPAADDARVAEAVRFRSGFGLRADVAFVRETILDTLSYSTEPYGIPLSAAEIAEMLRRGAIQNAMDAALDVARTRPDFAGAYLDQQRRGRPVFLFTSDRSSLLPELEQALPGGSDPQVGVAARTELELLALKDRIVGDLPELWSDGIRVAQVGVDIEQNTVFAGVINFSDAALGQIKDRYGEYVVVTTGQVVESDVCEASNNCRPIKGGISMNPTGNPVPQCTSGFVVKRTDTATLAILTAGHCIQVNGGRDQAWQHNAQGFGRALYETWVPGGSGTADVGLITIQSPDVAIMTNKNQMRRTNGSVANVTSVASPVQNGQACRVGLTSGHDCGMITVVTQSNLSEVNGWQDMTVTETTRVNFDSSGGDSGGPVFFYPGGGTCCTPVTALGTHVHSEPDATGDEGWFSSYSRGRSAYAALFPGGQTYNLCLTASC